MTTIEKFNALPKSFLSALLEFIKDDDNFDILMEELKKTSVLMEMDNFQLSIDSSEELDFMKNELEHKFSTGHKELVQ